MADDPDYLLVKTILGQQLSQESLMMAPGEESVAVGGEQPEVAASGCEGTAGREGLSQGG